MVREYCLFHPEPLHRTRNPESRFEKIGELAAWHTWSD